MPAQSGNNLSISQIRDGLINPNFTTPLYVSANSFTVAGDVTSWLRPGRGVVLTFQTAGIKRCIIVSLSYDSGTNKTTINVTGDSLTNETITEALISFSDLEATKNYVDTHANDKGTSHYIRIGNTQICWGRDGVTGNGGVNYYKAISFPVEFKDTSYTVTVSVYNDNQGTGPTGVAKTLAAPISRTKFQTRAIFDGAFPSPYKAYFLWIAVGPWQ